MIQTIIHSLLERPGFYRRNKVVIASFLLICMLAGCKPTEKGYKAAYDAAKNKREAAIADLGVDTSNTTIQQVDGPHLRKIDGVEVFVDNLRLKRVDSTEKLPGNFNVAVASYKMPTNCKAQAKDLVNEGFDAFPAQDTTGKYYVIAGSFPTQKEALEFVSKLKENKERVYVGLSGAPVIIYSPK